MIQQALHTPGHHLIHVKWKTYYRAGVFKRYSDAPSILTGPSTSKDTMTTKRIVDVNEHRVTRHPTSRRKGESWRADNGDSVLCITYHLLLNHFVESGKLTETVRMTAKIDKPPTTPRGSVSRIREAFERCEIPRTWRRDRGQLQKAVRRRQASFVAVRSSADS